MRESRRYPGHEQVALFRVGALIATEAVAVYIDIDRQGVPYDAGDFDSLPTILKLRVLEACEKEFKARRDKLLKDNLQSEDPTVEHLRIPAFD